MNLLKYSDLTKHQKAFITNGCGGKGGYINPPNFIFKASCNHHDFLFWRGHTKKDFIQANKDFYRWMKIDIKELKSRWHKKAYYHIWAFTYFSAVNIAGTKYFYFGERMKTLEDLEKEIEK